MLEKIEIIYMGFSLEVLEKLLKSEKFDIKYIICPAHRITKEIIIFSEQYKIKLELVKNTEEIEEIIYTKVENIKNILMYKFDYIINSNILKNINVYNIHPGSLNENRGRNPIERVLLKGEKTTEITLYKISSKIDLGEIVSKKIINIGIKDCSKKIEKKINKKLDKLIIELYKFITDNKIGNIIENGIYYNPINPIDYTINYLSDTIAEIYNKIRTQKNYNGAIINIENKEYRIKKLLDIKINNIYKEKRILEIEGRKVYIEIEQYILIILLRREKNE